MIIKKLNVQNYRTLENVEVEFKGYYTAISGKNNAGKSNIIRVIRGILNRGIRFRIRGGSYFGMEGFDWNDDVTNWKKTSKEDIIIELSIEIYKESDAAIYRFLTDFIFKDLDTIRSSECEELKISFNKKSDNTSAYRIFLGEIEIEDNYQKQEVLKRLKNTECLIFHNSTNRGFSPFDENLDRVSNFVSANELVKINQKRDELLKLVRKSLRHHQDELTNLLGNLEEKYEVSLSTRGLNFESESIDISLKEKGADISLDDWGSGTKNRTLIFLNILNAKRSQQMEEGMESDKITPVILIEEPESFLHPQAQAEFGRILQDLANNLQIQIIVTTHSPYLLCFKSPEANILLERNLNPKSKDTSSHTIDTHSDLWYEPFVNALGINAMDFGPMKDLIFSKTSKILLVEGPIDKEYFQYFQDEKFGTNALRSDIEIFAYDGADNAKNTILMNFIKKKFKKVVLTVDIDRYSDIKRSVTSIGFTEKKDLFAIGKNNIGKRCIEGLIPPSSWSTVLSQNPELAQIITLENGQEQKSAKNEMKKKLLDDFKNTPISDTSHGDFYSIISKLNKAFKD